MISPICGIKKVDLTETENGDERGGDQRLGQGDGRNVEKEDVYGRIQTFI